MTWSEDSKRGLEYPTGRSLARGSPGSPWPNVWAMRPTRRTWTITICFGSLADESWDQPSQVDLWGPQDQWHNWRSCQHCHSWRKHSRMWRADHVVLTSVCPAAESDLNVIRSDMIRHNGVRACRYFFIKYVKEGQDTVFWIFLTRFVQIFIEDLWVKVCLTWDIQSWLLDKERKVALKSAFKYTQVWVFKSYGICRVAGKHQKEAKQERGFVNISEEISKCTRGKSKIWIELVETC